MATMAKNLNVNEKVNGPVSAALLAGGIGSAAMGLITLVYEINDKSAFAKSMTWNKGVGGLSGKSGWAIIIFFIALIKLVKFFSLIIKSTFIFIFIILIFTF